MDTAKTDKDKILNQPTGVLYIVEITGSTNDDVAALGKTGAANGTAVAAHAQSSGRGRRNHRWVSPAGSLYLSVLLRPSIPSSIYVGLSVACALGILDGLRACNATENVSLKWPNDLLVDGRKLGGILLEAEEGFVVCGIGINLVVPEGIKAASDEPLGSLAPACLGDALSGKPTPSFNELAEAIRTGIIGRTNSWEHAMKGAVEPLAPMKKEYLSHLAFLTRQVKAVSVEGTCICTGYFTDVDGWGRAKITLPGGEIRCFSSEQASLRLI